MLSRLAYSVAVCLPLLACGGKDRPPPIDLNASSAGGAPDEGDGGGGKKPTSQDLRDGGFINLPRVSDTIYDDLRGVLYVSTTQGGLATVNLEDGKISSQKIGEGPLLGLDLSPSRDKLLICENSVDADAKTYWIHVADFTSNQLHQAYFEQFYYLQEGTHSAAFADDETIYLSTSFTAGGFVKLMRLTLAADWSYTSEEIGGVYSDAIFARSFDNSTIAIAEPNAAGDFSIVDTKSFDIGEGLLNKKPLDVAISPDASKLAFPVYEAVKLRAKDDSGAYVVETSIDQVGREARAAVFSPVSNSFYVTWGAKIDKTPAFIERYEADTLESEGIVQTGIKLADSRLGGYSPTRMRISEDGTLLFITVETGINVIKVEP